MAVISGSDDLSKEILSVGKEVRRFSVGYGEDEAFGIGP
jgi:hypothetical protein